MISITEWAGLATNVSPYSIPPGAAVTQVNLQCISPGQLTVRPGLTAVTLTSHTAGTQPIRRAARHPHSTEDVIYQDATGVIRVGTAPT